VINISYSVKMNIGALKICLSVRSQKPTYVFLKLLFIVYSFQQWLSHITSVVNIPTLFQEQ